MKTRVKNVVKNVRIAVEQKDADTAATALQAATSILDKAASKKVIHWRAASRRIARLSQAVNGI